LFLVAVLLGCLMLFSGGADAATEGDWEYSVDGNEATITGYSGLVVQWSSRPHSAGMM